MQTNELDNDQSIFWPWISPRLHLLSYLELLGIET